MQKVKMAEVIHSSYVRIYLDAKIAHPRSV